MDANKLIEVYRAMVTAREIDRMEQELTSRGEAFFHVSGAGHEGLAGLALHLTDEDWLHCHYRDKALMLRADCHRATFSTRSTARINPIPAAGK